MNIHDIENLDLESNDVVHVEDEFSDNGHYYVILEVDFRKLVIEALQITSAKWNYGDYVSVDSDDHVVIVRPSRIKDQLYEFDFDSITNNYGQISERASEAMSDMSLRNERR